MSQSIQKSLKQPKVFSYSFATAMFERFGFYVLTFLLVLYLKNEFHFTDVVAFALFSVFNALVYLTPAIGGYLADNIFGIKRTMICGLILEDLGLLILSIPDNSLIYFGLACIIIGVGLFKTGPTDILGRAYKENDPRIDAGFTWYYLGINVGCLVAPLVAGFVQRYFGWHIAFFCGAISLFIGLLVGLFFKKDAVKELDVELSKRNVSIKKWLGLVLGIIASFSIAILLIYQPEIFHIFFIAALVLLAIYFGYEIAKSTNQEKWEIIACVLLILIGMAFFIMYFQLFMSITLFIDRCVVRNIFGINFPTSSFLGLNPFWIVVLSPVVVFVYNYLGKRGKDLAITTKFTLGLTITSLTFFTIKFGTLFADANMQISSGWIIMAIFFYSLGELLISALGVAMVTRIAPKRLYGFMMGAWFLIATSGASSLSGSVSSLASIPETMTDPQLILNIYGKIFLEIGIAGLVVAVFSAIVGPHIKKIANLK